MLNTLLFFGLLLATGCVQNDPLSSRPTDPTIVDHGVYESPVEQHELPSGIRHAFAHVQPWSHEGQYFLGLNFETGGGHVVLTHTMRKIAQIPYRGHRWIGDTTEILLMYEHPVDGAMLYRYDMMQQAIDKPISLGHPGLRVSRSYRDTSHSGQWVAVYVDKGRDGTARILTVDLHKSEVVLDRPVQDFGCFEEPDWVGVDPKGEYLLVQGAVGGDDLCEGLWAFDITTAEPIRQITDHTRHGSLGVDDLGYPYFLTSEEPFPHEGVFEEPTRYWLDGRKKEKLGPPVTMGSIEHVSCLGEAGDPCLVSSRWDAGDEYAGQMWWLYDDGHHEIVGPHQAGGCHIWGNAQAVVGSHGKYAYATHDGDCKNIRSVLVD